MGPTMKSRKKTADPYILSSVIDYFYGTAYFFSISANTKNGS